MAAAVAAGQQQQQPGAATTAPGVAQSGTPATSQHQTGPPVVSVAAPGGHPPQHPHPGLPQHIQAQPGAAPGGGAQIGAPAGIHPGQPAAVQPAPTAPQIQPQPTVPSTYQKRERKGIAIIDPNTNKPIDVGGGGAASATSTTSSAAASDGGQKDSAETASSANEQPQGEAVAAAKAGEASAEDAKVSSRVLFVLDHVDQCIVVLQATTDSGDSSTIETTTKAAKVATTTDTSEKPASASEAVSSSNNSSSESTRKSDTNKQVVTAPASSSSSSVDTTDATAKSATTSVAAPPSSASEKIHPVDNNSQPRPEAAAGKTVPEVVQDSKEAKVEASATEKAAGDDDAEGKCQNLQSLEAT